MQSCCLWWSLMNSFFPFLCSGSELCEHVVKVKVYVVYRKMCKWSSWGVIWFPFILINKKYLTYIITLSYLLSYYLTNSSTSALYCSSAECQWGWLFTLHPWSDSITPHTRQLTRPVPWKSWHLPREWPVDSECLEGPDRKYVPGLICVWPMLFCMPRYSQAPRGQCFLCSRYGLLLCTAYRGCSSVSRSPGDISWYFLPTLRRSQVALQSFTFL